MDVPNFLLPLNSAPPSVPALQSVLPRSGPSSGLGGAPAFSDSIPTFTVPRQQQTNWCWAAVTLGVETFFNSATTETQCSIANKALGRADCCPSRQGNPCDQTWYLEDVLGKTGHLASPPSGPADFRDIQNQIALKRPLCCRIGWPGDGGHFVAIRGWTVGNSGTQYVDVQDPFYDSCPQSFSVFCSSYQHSGSWTDSYLTQ